MVVTFGTMLGQPEGDCSTVGYAWREYTTDMEPTGDQGLINCYATSDQGGLFVGDDFYFAMADCLTPGNGKCDVDGWQLAKYDAVTWEELVNKIYSLASGETAADPTVAFVNGQIDISGGTESLGGTHHNFFTTDLQFVSKRLLSDTPHIGFSSMITQGGITYFLSSKAGTAEVPWSVILMQYDPNWAYLGVKTLIEGAATPQGLAFDGNRFYVAYTERTEGGNTFVENVHLAAFDMSWNLVDDIALTSFTLQDQTSSIHPWLVLKDNRLYVSYSQNAPAGGIDTLEAHVAIYELAQ